MHTIPVYQFDELDAETQERVLDNMRAEPEPWFWSKEWFDSAQAFAKVAPVEVVSADFDRALAEWRWDGDSDLREMRGVRAWKWLRNNGWFDWARRNSLGDCLLTGYCGDCPLTDPIVTFERVCDDRTLEQLFGDCVQAWIMEARRDLEWCYSDEALREYVENNDFRFLADGRVM